MDNRRDYPLGRSPHQFIEEQAVRTPDAPALIMGERSLSYRELNTRANRLAHYLREQGANAESLVGVYLDRCFDTVVSFLAILKAGAVYLPLDPSFPEQRLAFMLGDAQAPFVLTQRSKRDNLPETAARIVFLGEEPTFLNSPADNLAAVSPFSRLAYVIYTSGSTGNPKGVMVPRSALTNFLLSMVETPGLVPADVFLAVTTVSFDISILELLLPLMTGARIVLASKEQSYDADELKRLMESNGVTVMQATPTTWRMLAESGWAGKSDLRILCGGEAMTSDLARLLLPRCRELWNMYGPTETTIWSSLQRITSADEICLGSPIANTQFYVVSEEQQLAPAGVAGELLIGGEGVAAGYLNRPELTAQKFIPDSFSVVPGKRLYRTGDEVRRRPDGNLEYIGRLDQQVKLRGFRIELGEIETRLAQIEGVREAVVTLREDRPGDKRLVGYYIGREGLTFDALSQALKATLPEYMVPSVFMRVEEFPRTPNAKLDRKALPPPTRKRPLLAQDYIAPRTALERRMADLWCEFLMLDEIGIDDNFFDLGGTSLAVVRMVSLYYQRFEREISPVKVFQYSTVSQLCRYLEECDSASGPTKGIERGITAQRHNYPAQDSSRDAVAVIGMVGRFPGAENLDKLWENLRNSVESISFFKPEELGPGIEEYLRNDPDYVRARGIIDGADRFDAPFFGISPLEAQVMDPQQRVFLELAYHALENAGYDPSRYKGLIGMFAGIGDNHYYTTNLLSHPDLLAMAGKLAVEYGNEKDYIALRVAYLLDLRGPAISLNTACSTSLTTIDNAYNALLNFECDMALAGGIDISVPQKSGFLYQEGGTFSRDGHCRPFDADATGTMFCDGAGIVVLKRLADALADGDTIYAVVRGSAKNNNGARPASFLAPSEDGQAEVIAMAQARANVPVESIGYVEAHGTGTPVGDPIEFDALCKVFKAKTDRMQFCYLGSIKGNIGHPTNAAGVAGFMKAALVLHREEIPPMLHFKKPNPKIDFANSPFIVADRLISFPRGNEPRRTAVSSFGFGGTNVHMILEEAPPARSLTKPRPLQLLLLSARTSSALNASTVSLAGHLQKAPEGSFADAAYTLQVGRKQLVQRRFVVAAEPREAVELLRQPHPLRCGSKRCERRDPPVVFLFGGQGTQYVNMGQNLYQGEPLFRAIVDDCCEHLNPHLGRDLRELLYPRSGDEEAARLSLQETFFTQPSLFVIEYALARLWQSWGVQPAMMVGHSIGEFVAATLSGVWDLPEVLRIVALRGKLMQNQPRGSMLAVGSRAENVEKMLPPSIQIASINAPSLCVVSGPDAEIASFAELLKGQEIVCRNLHTSHAFHSSMMDPIVEPLRAEVAKAHLKPPTRPFVSTVTGQPITPAEATDPGYWARHARATVRFSKAVQWLVERDYDLFLECGPRSTSCTLVRQHFAPDHPCTAIASFTDTHENNAEWAALLFALGSLWQSGVSIDWDAFYAHEERRRIPLPTYPFERQHYWVDPAVGVAEASAQARVTTGLLNAASVDAAPLLAVGGSARAAASTAMFERASVDQLPTVPAASPDAHQEGPRETRSSRLAARLVEILVPVSGRDRSQISTSATFLEQGFDSLSLTQVAFAIRKEFGVRVSFSQLMKELPSIEMLAAHLDAALSPDLFAANPPPEPVVKPPSEVADALGADSRLKIIEGVVAEQSRTIDRLVSLIEKLGIDRKSATPEESPALISKGSSDGGALPESAPLTVASTVSQRGIYSSSRLSDNLSASYNESMTLRLTGAISVPKLTRSIERLVERHDALRASFDESGAFMQIMPAVTVHVPVTDLSTIPNPTAREERLNQLLGEETAKPFPLPGGPLFRSQIVLLGADSAALVITGHHIICDGWSLDVMIHDLCAFYSEEISGQPARLRPVESYADYVRGVAQREQTVEYQEARDYWHSKFATGFPAFALPADHVRPARREFAARRLDRAVAAPLVQKLRALGTEQGCSFFSVILAAWYVSLAGISRQRRFVIALPAAEQPMVGQPDLVGHCVSLLPFAVDLVEGESVRALIRRVQNELAEAQDHSAYNLINMREESRVTAPGHGVSSTGVALTNAKKFQPYELPQSGFSADYDITPRSFQLFEWYLNVVEVSDRLELKCQYHTGLFGHSTAEAWLMNFHEVLSDMASDASQEVRQLAGLNEQGKFPPIKVPDALAAKAAPTVAGMAAVPTEAESGNVQRIKRRKQNGPCPLSFGQERLWYMSQLAPASPVYNIVDFISFEWDYDAKAMGRALKELVRRHESLRTTFSHCDGELLQTVWPTVDVVLSELNLSSLPDEEQEREWMRVVHEEGRRPFDLTQAPLLRTTMVHRSQGQHRLLLTIHHIIADEASMEIIHQEVKDLYRAFSQDRPSALRDLPIQYADYACWQQSWYQGEALAGQISYWKEELAGAPFVLELNTDKPRPALQSFRGATEIFDLPKQLLERLKSLGRAEQATLFMILEACFAALLYRYTSQDDILVGTPISGRTENETEGLIGFFVNMVVLRARFNDQLSFRSLLRQVRERALGVFAHSDLPFEYLVAELAPKREPSRTPLFQVMFALTNPEGASQISKVSGTHELATGTSKFDLTLFMTETDAGLEGLMEYSSDLFEAHTIQRLCAHYGTLLEAVSRHPDESIVALPILTDAERQQLLVDWNNTAAAYPGQDLCLHPLIEEQAGRTPDQAAVSFEQQTLTYGDLDGRANQLAHYLTGVGVGPEVLVGLLLDRSLELPVGLLGILKAGGAYVPLDPSFPENRLAYMVEDSKIQVLVTNSSLEDKLPRKLPVIVRLDADWSVIARQSTLSQGLPGVSGKNLAYVLYTSGSTGKPKGVEIPHSALVNFLLSMQRRPGFSATDVLLAVTTLSFDIAGLELYLPLVSGGRVVIAKREATYDFGQLLERIHASGCTVMQATPATWRALIDEGWKGSANLKILCGGEALPRDLAEELLARCGELWNMYGPTETTVWSTVHRVTSIDSQIPIGQPIANTQVYVLDGCGNLVPVGVVGELYIGGDGLARGYLHRMELTQERFVPNPFKPKTLLYRTGDRARWRADGTVDCLGRVDNQVKVRGFRIEPGEIETVLSSHEAIRNCAVIVREDVPGDRQLVAYIEMKIGWPPAVKDLRTHLEKYLPAYMVPAHFVCLEKLPLTLNGKIDRKSLPIPPLSAEFTSAFVAPRDPLEQLLAQIWTKVLKVNRMGVHDNFFETGGHSLLAVHLMVEIEKHCKIRLPLSVLLQAPTIAGLADVLRKEHWTPSWASLVAIHPGGSKRPLFLVHGAEGNVLLYRNLAQHLGADQPVYGLQAAGLDGKSPLDAQFEHVAGRYIEEIRQVQREGPYMLGGYCLGGTIALEMARQLQSMGETIGLLAMIESFNIKSGPWPLPLHLRLFNHFLNPYFHLLNLFAAEKGTRWKFLREKADVEFSRAKISARVTLSRALHWLGKPSEYPHVKVSGAFDQALLQYQVKPYPGELTLFMAQRHLAGMEDHLGGWGQVAKGGVRLFTLPLSPRGSLVEAHVHLLAARLRECLEMANNPKLMQTNLWPPEKVLPDSSHVNHEAETAA